MYGIINWGYLGKGGYLGQVAQVNGNDVVTNGGTMERYVANADPQNI